jgi:hypothetical protein
VSATETTPAADPADLERGLAADLLAHRLLYDVVGWSCRCNGWKQRRAPLDQSAHDLHVAGVLAARVVDAAVPAALAAAADDLDTYMQETTLTGVWLRNRAKRLAAGADL